jgi:hypothetical protein
MSYLYGVIFTIWLFVSVDCYFTANNEKLKKDLFLVSLELAVGNLGSLFMIATMETFVVYFGWALLITNNVLALYQLKLNMNCSI